MSVAISWANKMQLAKCDIMVGFQISSHILKILLETLKFSVVMAVVYIQVVLCDISYIVILKHYRV